MSPHLAIIMLAASNAFGAQSISLNGNSVAFDASTGVLSMARSGRAFATGRFMEPGKSSCTVERRGVMRIGPGENRVLLREGSPFVLVRRDARNLPPTPLNRYEALRLKLHLAQPKLVGLGPAGLFDPANNPGQHVVTAIADPRTGAGVVAGLVRIDAVSGVVFTRVREGKMELTLRNDYGSAVPPSLDENGGDWWAIGYFDDARAGLEAYANEFASLSGLKLKPLPVGYMSWYSEKYGGALNETAIVELAKTVAEKFGDYGYDFVQIDDLWQNGTKRNGPAKDFTRVRADGPYKGGMKPVADRIRALGLTPGLWLLPFAIDHLDPVLAGRVPMIVRKRDGAPWETNWSGTPLDLTRPEARDYVKSFIGQAVHDWGYKYLKLDGIHIGMACPQRYPARHYKEDDYGDAVFEDKTMSNMQAGRAGLRAVREAAGPETFILGCAVPQNERSLGMTMGLVDAMRVGMDSGVKWKGVVEGVRAAAALYFLNGRVWWNDPDSIYARASIPLNEVQTLAGWVTLTGMLNNQTDWAPDYPPERIDLLRRTMPSHRLTTVRPIDFFENDPARIWVLNYSVGAEKHTVAGFFNWTDGELEIEATAQQLGLTRDRRYAAFEFWSKRLEPPFTGTLKVKTPPRSCRILSLREAVDRPFLVSTSRHVTQGAIDLVEERWDAGKNSLTGKSRLVRGDPYELRILTNGKNPRIQLSQEDRAAGVTAKVASQDSALARIEILSPATRVVSWSVEFGKP